jgi:hypothetical protein
MGYRMGLWSLALQRVFEAYIALCIRYPQGSRPDRLVYDWFFICINSNKLVKTIVQRLSSFLPFLLFELV